MLERFKSFVNSLSLSQVGALLLATGVSVICVVAIIASFNSGNLLGGLFCIAVVMCFAGTIALGAGSDD